MNKTKKKIILVAIKLFNEKGLINISNQDIATVAGMGLSNFNYHFPTREKLIHAVCRYMQEIIEMRVPDNTLLSSEGTALEICKTYFEFEEEFSFFYSDTHTILNSYPVVKEEMHKQIEQSIQLIKSINYMAVGKGLMKPEPEDMPGLYDQLVEQLWLNAHFWFSQNKIRGIKKSSVSKGLKACYSILYPYLTEKGIELNLAFISKNK